jgi:arylsulfatase A-like enzyme
VAALERNDLRRSTLLIFASDNGCATYTAACSNGPLLGGKVTFFEGGVRVPFLASWPGTVGAGRVVDTPVSTLDVLPTALDLGGISPPPIGRSTARVCYRSCALPRVGKDDDRAAMADAGDLPCVAP